MDSHSNSTGSTLSYFNFPPPSNGFNLNKARTTESVGLTASQIPCDATIVSNVMEDDGFYLYDALFCCYVEVKYFHYSSYLC